MSSYSMNKASAASAGNAAALSYLDQVQAVTPVAGATVVMTDDDKDGILDLTPAGLLATLTVTFPSDANSRIGQVRRVTCSQIITSLTLNGATLVGGITSLAANGYASYQKTAANTWRRIG